MIGLRRRKPKLQREDFLRSIPVQNPIYAFERNEETGIYRIRIPRRRGIWADLLARWTRLPDHRTIELDEVGSRVIEWCDGKTPVRKIIHRIAAEYQLDIRAAEVSFVKYLDMLTRRGIVGLAVPLPKGRGGSKR